MNKIVRSLCQILNQLAFFFLPLPPSCIMECIPNAGFADQVESVRREILWLSMSMRYIEDKYGWSWGTNSSWSPCALHGQQTHSCGDEIAVSRLSSLPASMCTAQFCADLVVYIIVLECPKFLLVIICLKVHLIGVSLPTNNAK